MIKEGKNQTTWTAEKLKDLEKKYEKQFDDVFEAINYLLTKDNLEKQIKDRKKIGYMKT